MVDRVNRDKLISKHIKKKNFVKVYISYNGYNLTHFEGFIFEQNRDFILMSDMNDFNYDGLVVLRKSDISEIKHTDKIKFFHKILKKEKIKKRIFKRRAKIDFKLETMYKMMKQLKKLQIPIICEHLYEKEELFQIGPIQKVGKKKAEIKYFNALGKFDFKPAIAKYKSITYIQIDSPYANIFYKYVK